MKTFDVLIDRVLSYPFIVTASNEEEAEEKALALAAIHDWSDVAVISVEVVDVEEIPGEE